jgi:ADP-ribosylation factor GTPase-activating protein 1
MQYTNEILKELMKIPENKKCFDCNKTSCQWASVNNGIFLCTSCSGIHRGLGVDKSYVRSIQWDKWSDYQLEFMKIGGNKKLKDFLQLYSFDTKQLSAEQLYHTKIMEFYRKDLKNKVEGVTGTETPPSIEEAFDILDNSKNLNNEDKYSSVGSEKQNSDNLETNDASFQDNIKYWWNMAYEGTKDTINNFDIGNKITNAKNTILDTSSKIIDKTNIKNFFSSSYNWLIGTNSNNNISSDNSDFNNQSQNNNKVIDHKNNMQHYVNNSESKENIKNDININ